MWDVQFERLLDTKDSKDIAVQIGDNADLMIAVGSQMNISIHIGVYQAKVIILPDNNVSYDEVLEKNPNLTEEQKKNLQTEMVNN